MEKAYKNLGFVLILLIPIAIMGFYKSYIHKDPNVQAHIDVFVHIHALLATTWVGLMIAQPLLIRYQKYHIHRTLGRLSYILFPLFILSFIPLMIRKFDGIISIIHPLIDLILLLSFYILALINVKKPAVHMRYMIAIALVFLGPTLGRALFHWTNISYFWGNMTTWGGINILFASLIIWDKINGRNYRPYLLGQAGFLVYLFILFVLTS